MAYSSNLTPPEYQRLLFGIPAPLVTRLADCKAWIDPKGYVLFFYPCNKELFAWLRTEGFFQLHSTNKGANLVSLHQIVAFFYCGGKKLLRNYQGKYTVEQLCHEVNHINGITSDNCPDNLMYMSTQRHRILSQLQRGIMPDIHVNYIPELAFDTWEFNKQGYIVKSTSAWFANALALCITKCAAVAKKANFRIKHFAAWADTVIKALDDPMRFAFGDPIDPDIPMPELELDPDCSDPIPSAFEQTPAKSRFDHYPSALRRSLAPLPAGTYAKGPVSRLASIAQRLTSNHKPVVLTDDLDNYSIPSMFRRGTYS